MAHFWISILNWSSQDGMFSSNKMMHPLIEVNPHYPGLTVMTSPYFTTLLIPPILIPLKHHFLLSYHHHHFFMMSSTSTPHPLCPMDTANNWLEAHMHEQMAEISMDIEPPIPSMDPPQLSQLQDEAGPSNSPKFYWTLVFMGTPISQPTPPGPTTTHIVNVDGLVTTQMLTMGTLASRAGTPPSPHFFPPGEKLAKKKALPENMDLSMFDILNIFWCHWFLSLDHLRAQALSAQKAEDGKKIWVEFTPQFHTHLAISKLWKSL
jgi:hypothetical protein